VLKIYFLPVSRYVLNGRGLLLVRIKYNEQ
jgi:hypothetical protein